MRARWDRIGDDPAADRAVALGLAVGAILASTAAIILIVAGAASDPPPPTSTTTVELKVDIGEPLHVDAPLEHPAPSAPSRGIPRERAKPSREIAGTTENGYGGREHLGRFRVTCYGPPAFPAGARTATGDPVGAGSIAVDPRVIPLGTRLELDGLGAGRANDTGGAVKGHHVDLWRPSCRGWANPTVDVWRLP